MPANTTDTSQSSAFVHEAAIYQLLQSAGLRIPRHELLHSAPHSPLPSFAPNEPLVVKGLGDELWHKSDIGAVDFCSNQAEELQRIYQQIQQRVSVGHQWQGLLVCEKMQFVEQKGLPCELFVSLKLDECCGSIISFGFGGLLTEEWAKVLKDPVLIWPVSVYTPEEAMAELREHYVGKILLGDLRQQIPLVSEKVLLDFLKKLWRLDALMKQEQLALLEVNPMVITDQGEFCALDGVGLRQQEPEPHSCPVPVSDQALLAPQSIAIAGVSAKQKNVGHLILDNLRRSQLPLSAIRVIKADAEQIDGIRCIADVSALKADPVDILILSVPATACVDMINQICVQDGGASVIYIVAGGIGDGADQQQLGDKLSHLLRDRRQQGLWCPAIVGPNGLGMINSLLKLNTLFIPQSKLNVQFSEQSPVALISQSGAFLITRLSRHTNLNVRYGFSIGNQLDLKLSDFLSLIEKDQHIKVVAVYAEGFAPGDICAITKIVKRLRQQGRHLLVYKGGRSALGQNAAAGHTGALAGNYQIQKRLLQKAGAIVVETFNQFNAVFKWLAANPDLQQLGYLGIIANAGYETVGSVDTLSDTSADSLLPVKASLSDALEQVIRHHRLEGLVVPANPMDLTPMAGEKVYADCVEQFALHGAGAVILGMVPLTDKLATEEVAITDAFVQRLQQIAAEHNILIGIVIDAGNSWDGYKRVFEQAGFAVFDSMDIAVLGINILKKSG